MTVCSEEEGGSGGHLARFGRRGREVSSRWTTRKGGLRSTMFAFLNPE